MNPQKKIAKSSSNNAGNNSNFARKPRRSIKAEGNCLNGMLREGCAKVIDASKLGKRLSSEIWNSFGAIQVEDNFTYPAIETKTVADGSSTLKICQFFVACSRCFSVFKYDGHAYGTTGLVKHVKICQGTNQRANYSSSYPTSATTTTNPNATTTIDHNIDNTHTSTVPNNTTATTTTINGPVSTRRRREPTNKSRNAHPSLRHLAKIIEELRCEQSELRQKIQELINMIGTSYVERVQIISNDGDKVEEDLHKTE